MPNLSSSRGWRTAVWLTAAASGAVLAGCGSSSTNPGTSTPSSPGAPSSPATAPAAGAKTVTATENEFHIKLSQQTFATGSYTFQATNSGTIPHALTIDGPGVSDVSTGILKPGQSGTMTVALKDGSYNVYCPVDHHKAEGMSVNITVSGAGAGGNSSPAASPTSKSNY